jgi:hypothetical protein
VAIGYGGDALVWAATGLAQETVATAGEGWRAGGRDPAHSAARGSIRRSLG